MELWINTSKFLFLIASKAVVMGTLILIALLIPFYNAIRFEIVINYSFMIDILLSIVEALTYYFVIYGMLKLMSIIVNSIDKNAVNFTPFLLIILVPVNLQLYWKVLTVTSWGQYESLFNINLIILVAFYAMGNFYFFGSCVPKRNIMIKESLAFYQSCEVRSSGFVLTIIVVAILIFMVSK